MPFNIILYSALIASGIFVSYWARRFQVQGIELWLPFSIITGMALGLESGLLLGGIVIAVSFALHPHQPEAIFIMVVSLFVALYTIQFFTITSASFFFNAMLITLIFHAFAKLLFFFTGAPWIKMIKITVLSLVTSGLVYSIFGWPILKLLV